MYAPRHIETSPDWLDPDRVKLYTVSFDGTPVVHADYLLRLQAVKRSKALDWPSTPSFAIFHEGTTHQYMVLAWWGNENELLTSVSVREGGGEWIVDPDRHSFCVWDLEIFWAERNIFVETMYSGRPDLSAFRRRRLAPATPGTEFGASKVPGAL